METATARPLKTQIVVVGGGAAGLALVKQLGTHFGRERYDIILVEKARTHIWKPLLHEVAAGSLDANLDEVGYRSHGHSWGYRFFHGAIEGIDRKERRVMISPVVDDDGAEIMSRNYIRYDCLVLAVGSVSNDFGVAGVSEHCMFLDSRADADRFRNRLLDRCLALSRDRPLSASADIVSVSIVGGGATGVELAAELFSSASELRHYGLEVFDETRLRVTLVEAGDRLLPALPRELSESVQRELEGLGVRVMLNEQVAEARKNMLLTKSGQVVDSTLCVWAAGVRGPDILKELGGLEIAGNNQLLVKPTLQSTLDDRIFAIGDCAYLLPEGAQRPIPPRAQAANQMALATFKNIKRMSRGERPHAFVYRDFGSLISLSRFTTVGSLMGGLIAGRLAIQGRIARIVYVSLYRRHLLTIHGWATGLAVIAMRVMNRAIRPRLKLH